MTAWWASLSWSHGALLVGLIVLAGVALLWYAFASLIAAATRDCRPRTYPLCDYSAAFERQREWLGDRFLLAKPINRRVAR